MTDLPPDAPPKVTRARAVTVGAADPSTPRRRPPKAVPETIAPASRPSTPVMADRASAAPEAPGPMSVTIQQGGIGEATATTIDITQGGIGAATATDIALSQGGIGLARGERVSVEMGAVGLAVADEVRISQAVAQTVIAREATFEQGVLVNVIAEHVTVRQPSFVGILLANRVDGDVRALLDWRGALAAGAVIGLLVGVLRRR